MGVFNTVQNGKLDRLPSDQGPGTKKSRVWASLIHGRISTLEAGILPFTLIHMLVIREFFCVTTTYAQSPTLWHRNHNYK